MGVTTYKGRRINRAQPVEVWRNHRGDYSVRQAGRIVGHAAALMLADAKFVRNRVIGYLTRSGMGTTPEESDLPVLHYSRKQRCFLLCLSRTPREMDSAMIVAFNDRGLSAAYCEVK